MFIPGPNSCHALTKGPLILNDNGHCQGTGILLREQLHLPALQLLLQKLSPARATSFPLLQATEKWEQ